MLVKELIEILESHDQNAELRIATNRLRPFQADVRGVVKMSSPTVYLCADEIMKPMDVDAWQELDGPLPTDTINI
mgnify:FL=1|jgi:hypothetical protein